MRSTRSIREYLARDLLSTTDSIHELACALDVGFIRCFPSVSAFTRSLQRFPRFRGLVSKETVMLRR